MARRLPKTFVEAAWKPILSEVDSSVLRRGKALSKQLGNLVLSAAEKWIVAEVPETMAGRRGTERYQVQVPVLGWWEPFEADVVLWLCRRPDWLAALCSGEWDGDFLDLAKSAGLSILPSEEGAEDFVRESRCSCMDVRKPCRHVVAVYWQMIWMMEQDPLTALEFVGLSRQMLDLVHVETARELRTAAKLQGQEEKVMSEAAETVQGGDRDSGLALWEEERVLLEYVERQTGETVRSAVLPQWNEDALNRWKVFYIASE